MLTFGATAACCRCHMGLHGSLNQMLKWSCNSAAPAAGSQGSHLCAGMVVQLLSTCPGARSVGLRKQASSRRVTPAEAHAHQVPSLVSRCESDSRGMVRGRMMAIPTRAPEHRRVWLQQAALAPFPALAADVALA